MTIKPKQAKLGYTVLGLSIIVFFAYWYYLLEPLQAKLIDAHKSPSLILTALRSLVAGGLFTFLFFVGGSIGGFAWQKYADAVKLRLGDALESKSFWIFMAASEAGFLLFSLLWKYGNF